jgi:hypothetical protein
VALGHDLGLLRVKLVVQGTIGRVSQPEGNLGPDGYWKDRFPVSWDPAQCPAQGGIRE